MRVLTKIASIVAAAVSVALVTAAPAVANPLGCGYPAVENVRPYNNGMQLRLQRCPSDHPGAYLYRAQLTATTAGDRVRLYYFPYGRGVVPDSEAYSYYGGDIATKWFYGKPGELQACALIGGRPLECAWPT